MKIHEYNEMMAYLTRPARTGFKHGGTWKDYMLRGEEYKDLSFEEWLREDKAYGGRIGFAGAGSVHKGGRKLATEGPSAYIRQVLGKLPKGGRFDAEALAREIIKKFPDSSKSFIDKRTNTISTSTIFKVIQRDKLLKPLELKPYDQTEKTIIRIQNFVDDFIKTNNREPTVGEVKIGAKTDPKQLTQYKNKGLITGIQDTVFDAHKIAINYLNNTKNPTMKGLQKLIGGAQGVESAETLLSNMYRNTLEAMRNRAAGIEQQRSVYKDFSIKELDALKRKVRAVPGYKDKFSRQIEDIVSEAYKNQPKKLNRALKKIGKFKKLNSELKKIGVNLQLDHPLSYDFIEKAMKGADPEELIRVKPIPDRVNLFKSNLDSKIIEIADTLKKNPGDKKALDLYMDAQSIARDLGVDIGKISKAGNIISAQAAKVGDVPLLPDVKKGAAIQNAYIKFVEGIKDDPRVKNLGIKLDKLTDLAKVKAVDSKEYLKVVDEFVGKFGKFGISVAGAYGVYKAAGFDTPVMADDTGQMPQGSPGQLSEDEEGLSLQDKAAIGTVAVAGAKPALQGTKWIGKKALQALGSVPAALSFFTMTVRDGMKKGKSFQDAVIEAESGIELLYPNLARKAGFGMKILNPIAKRLTPWGWSIAGAGVVEDVFTKSQPGMLQGKFDPEKADQVFPALIEGYEKKWMGKDESPYMDYSDAMLKMKDPDDLKATYIRNQMTEDQLLAPLKRYIQNLNQGGRVGFKDGSPKSPGRRAFLKGITALAALPVVGRVFKLTEVAKQASTYASPAIEKIKGMPEWFPQLVKKLFNEGEDVTKTASWKERQVVKRGTLEGGDEVDMIYDLDTGNVSIEVKPGKGNYETSSGAYNKEYGLEYTKGQADETTKGKKPPDEFEVAEIEGRADPDAMDVDWDGTMTTVDDAMSDLTELEAFAKNKTTAQIHKKKGTKPKDVFPDYDSDWYDPLDD